MVSEKTPMMTLKMMLSWYVIDHLKIGRSGFVTVRAAVVTGL